MLGMIWADIREYWYYRSFDRDIREYMARERREKKARRKANLRRVWWTGRA